MNSSSDYRANNRSAIRALTEIDAASRKTAANAERSFAHTTRGFRAVGTAAESLGRTMTGVGLGMAAVGYFGAKAAINFQTQMERIHTQARVSQHQVDLLTGSVLNLAKSGKSQFGPEQLAKALYHIESVAAGGGIRLKNMGEAMDILKTASEGAALGGSDLEDTTTALVSAMTTLHEPASRAQYIMGLLNTTVGIGNMRMQDLVYGLGRGALPAFKLAGLGAKDLFAALALTSDQGTKASSAAAQLATAIHYIAGPSDKARKVLEYLHLPASKLGRDFAGPGGLLAALKDINEAMKGLPQWKRNIAAFDILPAGRGRVLLQVLNNVDQYAGKLKLYKHPVDEFHAAVKAQSYTMAGKLHSAWAVIQADLIIFGDKLLPIIRKDLPIFLTAIQRIFEWLDKLSPSTKNFLAKLTVGLLIGGPILVGLGKMAKLFAAIATAVRFIAGINIFKKLAALAGFGAAASGAAGAAGGAGAAGAAAKAARTAAAADAVAAAAGGAGVGGGAGAAAKFGIRGILRSLGWVGAIYTGIQLMNLFGTPERNAPRIKGAGGHMYYNPRVAPFTHNQGGVVKGYQFGGAVDSVPAWLTPGEGVLTKAAMAGLGTRGLNALNAGGGFGNMTIQPAPVYIILDGRVVAKSVLRQVLRQAARGPSSLVGGSLVSGVSVPVNRGFG